MQIAKHVVKNYIIPKSHSALGSSRSYAVHSVNKPAPLKNLPDPVAAAANRAPTYHLEKQCQECTSNSDCKNNDCPTLCGPAGDREATGHFTSKEKAPSGPNKKLNKVSDTTLSNQQGYQGFMSYDEPYETPATAEHLDGTKKLNTDPNFRKSVLDSESKK